MVPEQAQDAAGPKGPSPHNMSADSQLLLQRVINDKDADACAILYAKYYVRMLCYVAARLHDTDNAEDLVQDIFVQLWETRAYYEVRGCADVYLFTVANRVIARYMRERRRQRRHVVIDAPIDDLSVHVKSVDHHHADWISALLSREGAARGGIRLSPKCREAVRLRFILDLSLPEAARTAGCSLAAFYSRLERALRLLRQAGRENL